MKLRLDWTPQGKRSRGRPRQITSKFDLDLVDTALLGDPYELMFESNVSHAVSKHRPCFLLTYIGLVLMQIAVVAERPSNGIGWMGFDFITSMASGAKRLTPRFPQTHLYLKIDHKGIAHHA